MNLAGKRAVVVGLGPVGRRKAASLVACGAEVVGIDPAPLKQPLPGVEHRAEQYHPDHLLGASIGFAAATPEVNRRVVDDARRLGVWVSSASEPGSGDFTLPAVWRDGPIVVSVSTSGASPALAASLRDRIAGGLGIGPAASGLAALLVEIRPEVLRVVTDPEARRRAFREMADPRWLDHFDREGVEATRRALRSAYDLTNHEAINPSIPTDRDPTSAPGRLDLNWRDRSSPRDFGDQPGPAGSDKGPAHSSKEDIH